MTLVEEFKELLKNKDYSISMAAKSINFSKTAVNLWMNNKYTGNIKKIEDAVSNFIRMENIRSGLVKVDFINTSVVQDVYDIARSCHIENEIGVCFGASGLGKTYAVKKYATENPDVILIEADFGYSPKVLFSEIHKLLGLSGKGTIHELLVDVIDKLKYSGRLIIVDEAEQLSYKTLELLRRIYDKAHVGILLVGMPLLINNLKGHEGQYAQLYSRVGIVSALSKLNENDEYNILNSILPNQESIYPIVSAECDGNTRVMTKVLMRAIRLAEINKQNINKNIINASLRQIIK